MRGVLAPLLKMVAFALVTALATAILGFTIANVSFGPKDTYTALFTDVTGLLEGDDVRISGVVVGTVQSIEIVERRLAKVEFTVGASRTLPASVTASVLYQNLIGQRYLALEQTAGTAGALEPGATIPLERTDPPLDLTVLFNGFKPLMRGLAPKEINKLSFEIVQVLQGQSSTVESLLAHTASLTKEIANRDQVIGELISNLNIVLETVNARDERLSDLIVQLQRLVSGLAADRQAIGDSIESINSLAESTAGLVDEARPALREDIAALGQLSSNLADHEQVIDRTLRVMPEKLAHIVRTASYGSFFNFYLCEVSGTFVLPGVTPEQGAEITPYTNPNPRCTQ